MRGYFKRDCPYMYSHDYQGAVQSQPPRRGPVPNNWEDPNASADTQRLAAAKQYQVRGVGTKKSSKKVYLKIKIHGQPQYCLLDSGSEISLIPSECVGKRRVLPTTKNVWAANGTVIPIAGWIELTAFIRNIRTKISGFVTDHVKDVFLGSDWLQDNNVQWDFGSGSIVINGARCRLMAKMSKENWCRRVIVEEDVVVPSRSQCNLRTKAVFRRLPLEGAQQGTWATEPH